VEEDRFERSIEILRKLRQLDPADTTGAANLWERGWRDYNQRNYTGAVGYWTELYALYPDDANGRRGRYWTARAFDSLGEAERAHQIYAEVAGADTTDFYRKNALARLRRQPVAASEREPEPWPADPMLARARLLTDLGLDDLALSEAALVAETAQPRAMRALEALVLARQGQRRKSVQVIRDAFPALGGAFQANLPEQARRLYYPLDYQEPIRTWSGMNHLPPHLVFGIIRQESAFDPNAQSWAGARGLMQLMPATARRFGLGAEEIHDPAKNLDAGARYLAWLLERFGGDLLRALAAYNAGEGTVERYGGVPPFRETRDYLRRIYATLGFTT
jgi:soluble lytic murein transglycosylase-like protein